MRKTLFTLALALSALCLSACQVVYKPDIQQGNVLDESKVERLTPGMTQEQVLALLGPPMIASPFAQNRWDYVHTKQHRGGKIETRDFTVFFQNGVLVRTEGNYQPEDGREMLQQVSQYPMILHNKEKEAEARRRRGGGGG